MQRKKKIVLIFALCLLSAIGLVSALTLDSLQNGRSRTAIERVRYSEWGIKEFFPEHEVLKVIREMPYWEKRPDEFFSWSEVASHLKEHRGKVYSSYKHCPYCHEEVMVITFTASNRRNLEHPQKGKLYICTKCHRQIAFKEDNNQ